MLKRTLALCAGVLVCISSQAKHVYQYIDAQGIVHYTDVKPGEDVKEVKSSVVHVDRQPLIRLRREGGDDDQTEIFVNSAGGPVSVDIAFDVADNVQSQPQLPARIVLPGLSETPAVHITPIIANASFRYQLRYTYMPGDFRARHSADARYRLPFPESERFPIAQAFGGEASHTDKQNHYAVDIAMPEGTPVLAARDGVVMTVDNDFYGAGQDLSKYGDRANNIRIAHSDGTMAVYAHLQMESARVSVGDRVHAGQQIALSGNTGFTRGPHLHFVVQQNVEMDLIAVPFKFTGANGEFVPERGMVLSGY
jgi:murein DD-endopeptidase MepM/ murein hydrolase activator NlpD